MRYLLLIIASICLSSCDNRQIYVEELNDQPEISFVTASSDKAVYSDSVKISVKSPRKSVDFYMNCKDINNNLKEINYSLEPGKGKLFQNNTEVTNGKLVEGDKYQMRFEPSAVGMHKLSFTVIDEFDKKKSAAASIYAFSNLPPIAKVKLNPVKVLSPYEYEIDASGSYDTDTKWGGGISVYTFYVNGNEVIKKTEPRVKFIFPQPGNYTIKVTVSDFDGESDSYSKTETIN